MPTRSPAPTYANVLATLALIAALIAVVVAVGDSHETVNTQIIKQPASAPARSAEPAKTTPSTLAAGTSESGEYDERTDTSTEKGYVDEAVSFPIPLPAALQVSHVLYGPRSGGTSPQCPGPGHAKPGYLCIYSAHRSGSSLTGPEVYDFGAGRYAPGTSRFGFDMEWHTTEADTFDAGTWTVTAE
jgi:hypothetical protein